ncbi:tripartite tricarboxylate transporter substrate binding protein [Bordetella sp. BOR01]|uniref:Bug family tripartite tricarboxylate transporter substrate binding protein n=1 Tax=Bordetella sp. BOR01 TaxID=2854779 RepID=UPI001C496E31|nr:tripartite tricarboxylate transporter substrate binding protein [Bordetella sp. BOR01]MBV7486728.1 tripartite tricarboxylate transporter substrate binding protein [Bordetella sp. BOR01]
MIFSVRKFLAPLALAASVLPAAAHAGWPEKPVTIIVPWAAGGSTDILARLLSEHMTQSLGQPVVVENRSGASGNIGSAQVARAEPDGYTLLVGSMSTHTMNQAMYSNMPFDGVKDFTPIAELALVTNTMVINPSLPVKNVAEFIEYAKARPEKIAYASAGAGSTNHLSAALFEKATGIRMLHVPYRGGAPAVMDTVADRTQLLFSAGTQTLPHVQVGKLKLLAVTESRRSPLLPDVPTVAETLPGYELAVWYGAFGPAGMDPALVQRLNKEINQVLAKPEVIKKMGDMGVEVMQTTPAQFADTLARDADKYGKLVRDLGITLQ